ncbi:MAG TPA: hypothetical protein ENI33_06205 [Thermoplasmatales archaeon]|nr:hypothetical protein [Thermoplasmatales archaeon]
MIEEKKVRLKLRDNLFSSEKKFNMSLYKLELRVKDTWGFAPSVDVSPTLTSNEMIEHVSLTAEIIRKGSYLFTNLYPSSYILRIGYKSFTVEKNVSIDEDKIIEITFPAEFEISFNVMNSYGMHLKEGDISVARGNKILQIPIEKGNAKVFLPPGEYDLKIYLQNEEVAKQKINIHGNKEINIVTMHTSYFHEGIKYLGIIFAIFSIIFLIWKKNYMQG